MYLDRAQKILVKVNRWHYTSIANMFEVCETTSCWNWTGGLFQCGYSRIKVMGRTYVAHRYLYEQLVTRVEDELELDHLCRNKKCVNPEHLEPVTSRENQIRGNTFSRINSFKTHCVNGHEFTEENTMWIAGIKRRCR